MSVDTGDPLGDAIARASLREERHAGWLRMLRAAHPGFREVSELRPATDDEWQAATFLLTGCGEVWSAVRATVLQKGSVGAGVERALASGRPWASSERAVLRWAGHLWNVNAFEAPGFPWQLESPLFTRWSDACLLRKHLAPADWSVSA